ncbi:putative Methyltransferase TARBP1 [Daphnia magna]|uniref:tRNA (guanosine(18)-2'-O)-methyltransferase TARBP1 n=1 Tax=Daphnia magna TaxID=35525 RepID=A0A0P6C8V0_9CRUS|nr:putative Methyltransferase TARBP1 [Daphnia magna]
MGEDISFVLSFVREKSLEEAIEKVLGELRASADPVRNWKVLHLLLSSAGKSVKINTKDIVNTCLSHLKKQDNSAQARIICKILIIISEKAEKVDFENELEAFLEDLQLNIIRQSNTHQQHDECTIDYQTATTILSLTLPTFVKTGMLQNQTRLLEVFPAMIQSRNENSIVEALAFMLPAVIHYESLFETVCNSIQELFESEDGLDKLSNHPGLTALCSIGDILFSKNIQHAVLQETWFHRAIQRGLSNPAALNRKRSQYLLKRYVDATDANVNLFNDFILVMETLEEKQMHIINPVLTRMKSLEDRMLVKKESDSSWILCIYNRLLSHENIQVIKWGLHNLCQLNIESWPGIGHSDWLYDALLMGLNNMVFYVRDKACKLPQLGIDLGQFLQKCATLEIEREGFFIRLLGKMSVVPWNAVGLFHLVYAFASLPRSAILDGEALQIVLEFLRSALHTHHPLLRGAIQGLILEFVLNMTVVSQENLLWIALILATINPHECYIRTTPLYATLKAWINENFTPVQHGQLLDQLLSMHFEPSGDVRIPYSVDVTAVARFAVLLLDVETTDLEGMRQMQIRLEPLADCQTRLYADPRTLSQRMKLMVTLLDEVRSSNSTVVVRLVFPFTESVIHYCLDQIESAANYNSICESLSVLISIAKMDDLIGVIAASGKKLEMMARKLLDGCSALEKFKSISIFYLIARFNQPLVDQFIHEMISLKMHCRAPQRDDSALEYVTWGAFMSHYFSELWTLIKQRLAFIEPKLNPEELLNEAICAMDIAGVEAVKSIFSCLGHLLPQVCQSNPDLCLSSLKACWTVCFEYRRSDHFWDLMEQFAKIAFNNSLMEKPEIRPQLFGFLSELKSQGENILQLFNFSAERIIDIWTTTAFPSNDSYTIQFIVDLISFGLIHRRDEMIFFETCAFVRSLGERCPANIHLRSEDMADGKVRFQGLRFLLSLNKLNEQHMAMVESLVEALLKEDKTMSETKTRYFSSSHGHRVKHRLWLALIMLQDLLPLGHKQAAEIMEAALSGLVDDNPQPSVRFLQEWAVVRTIYHSPELEKVFWKTMDDAVEQRAGSMVSFLSIIGHETRCLADCERLATFASNALPHVIPWAMAQHFTPRLYATVILGIIWKVCESSKIDSLLERYSTTQQILRHAPDMPNTQRNLEKLSQDFYFSVFHPLSNFTLETLCFHLPRLSHLVCEEWLPAEWFDGVKSWIPCRNTNGQLADCQPAEWVARAAGGAPAFTQDDSVSPAMAVRNVQKKITPWKQMLPDVNSLVVSASRKKTTTNDLIVIASLVDRVPNLGGLCRTCEVLGVRDYVLSSLRITEEKDFVSLSVSAEKWINVLEIKPFQLVEYVKQLKLEGYTVVGAEQTASSKPLNNFTFPKKSALILGHEKEGIPVELIQHLDVCVEVPQEGIIRSMNVHVTGAIFIWEYARQQMELSHIR